MRRFWILVPAALAIMALALGCGSGEKAETAQNEPAATEDTNDQAAAETHPNTGGKIKVPEGMELASVNLEGTMGCGHCSFQVKDECTLAFKDADGEIYIVEAGDQQEELMEVRIDEPSVFIAGRIGEVDGQKVIYTDSVELR